MMPRISAPMSRHAKFGDAPIRFMKTFATIDKPVVAAVDGLSVGIGTILLLHCDFVVASEWSIFSAPCADSASACRRRAERVMMFKILVIQATNNLSDERAEYLINDRLSFMRFLGLDLSDRVPDARTIWLFREKLTRAGAIGSLFECFDAMLRQSGYIAMSGQIVDASLVAAPRQRNTDEEKKAIKDGRVPDQWKDKPAKLRQKDRDARWTVKFTKAKPREDARRRWSIWRSRHLDTRTMSRSIVASASSANLLAPAILGYHRAFELLVLGEQFDTQRGLQSGLINRVVPAEEVDAVAFGYAKALAAKPPEAVRMGRRLMRGDRRDVLTRINQEAASFADLLRSPAALDALTMFIDRKRD